jgi:hypothetical protein
MPRGGLAPERRQSHVGRKRADGGARPAPYGRMRAAENCIEFGAAEKMHVVARPGERGQKVAEALAAARGAIGPHCSGIVDSMRIDHRWNAALYEQACPGDRRIGLVRPNQRLELDIARLPPHVAAGFRAGAKRVPAT